MPSSAARRVPKLGPFEKLHLTEKLRFPAACPIEEHPAYQRLYGDQGLLSRPDNGQYYKWLSAAPREAELVKKLNTHGKYFGTNLLAWSIGGNPSDLLDTSVFRMVLELDHSTEGQALLKGISVPESERMQGYATMLLAVLTSRLKSAGYKTLDLIAGGERFKEYNKGFLAFPAMGFECTPIVDLSDDPGAPKLRRIDGFDMHRYPELLERWRRHGGDIYCEMSLQKNSKSLKHFSEYLLSKGVRADF